MIQRSGGRAAREITPETAAALVKSGDWLDYGATFNQPDAFDRALAARRDELRDVSIRNCLSMRPRTTLEGDPERKHFAFYNWHFSGYDRRWHDAGRVTYTPCNLGEIPHYYRRNIERVDIAILKAAAPDADGYLCLGPNSLWHGAVMVRAKRIVIEASGIRLP
jgi:acyl-CoA hydrolase